MTKIRNLSTAINEAFKNEDAEEIKNGLLTEEQQLSEEAEESEIEKVDEGAEETEEEKAAKEKAKADEGKLEDEKKLS